MIKTSQIILLQRIHELEREFNMPVPRPSIIDEYRDCLKQLTELTKGR